MFKLFRLPKQPEQYLSTAYCNTDTYLLMKRKM